MLNNLFDTINWVLLLINTDNIYDCGMHVYSGKTFLKCLREKAPIYTY